MRTLVAIPVYNEAKYVRGVLERVLTVTPHVLVVDDGSTDGTARLLPEYPVEILRHVNNRGYGSSMRDAFRFAVAEKFDWLITMDCDDQHEPAAIPEFLEAAAENTHDVISGSRYLRAASAQDRPPADRRAINQTITAELNCRLSRCLGTLLTDSFCGFKAYRVSALRSLRPTVRGYAFPMQFWAQAAAQRLRVRELPVRLIYNDPTRTFGGVLDDAEKRLAHYRHVLHRELRRRADRLPRAALLGIDDDGCECRCP
ncbi:MAG: dolichyl-phosphate mannose synthase [Phycisphaerae bacterium]|nr:MAG: dolichyl-phosphate mannose synthase [Phycisphaerae bacterium]